MAISLRTTELGGAAHAALASAIADLKDGRALAPVAVLVPSNYVGIAARRAIGRQRGIAAVTFLTPYRLAELLGAPAVAAAGRRPVSTPVIAGAVRAVLADAPGHFAGVHTHPATERSLVRAHRALSEVEPEGLAAIASTSSRAADVVRVHRAVADRLRPTFSNEQDLIDAAVDAMTGGHPVLDELGPAVLHLPQRLTANQVRVLAAFGAASELHVIAGTTGNTEADAPVRRSVEALGLGWPESAAPTATRADRGVSVSDADDEVRHALRTIVDATRAGTPLGRCAVLYGSRDPYARLLGDAFDAAGLDWFGTCVETADASLLGRSLLALLALPDHDFSRRDVAAWLAGAPIRGIDNRPAPVAAWERASRAAGVIAGPDQWAGRLGRLVEELEADATQAEKDEEQSWRADRHRREADQASELAQFVADLVTALDPGGQAASWKGLAAWCRRLVRTYVGGETLREQWPPDEKAAAQRIDAAIDRLGDLDGIDPNPSVAAFRRALELQLADDIGRHGTFGNGVLLGPAHMALGLELDVVVIVGMAEGSFPARRRDDPLLPDRVRTALPESPHGRDLPTRADLTADEHRALLGVLAAAGHVTMTFPRGDLRRSAERAPSRWLLDTVEAHEGAGVRPAAADLGRHTGDWFTEVPSFIAGLRATGFPGHIQEYDVRALLDTADAGDEIATHPLLDERPELRRGVDLIAARLGPTFTRFHGNLTAQGDADLRGVTLPTPLDPDHVTSATRLETWSKCPHAYFVGHVLGVRPVEDPEQEYRISPLTLGNLVHHALEQWIAEALQDGSVPAHGGAWSDDARARLLQLAADEAERLAAKGLVGRAVYWHRDRQVMMSDLAELATVMDRHQRVAHGCTPIHTELPFGMPHEPTPPVTITLPSGRALTVRGSIDRVDETSTGDLVVIDYKTGKRSAYKDLSEENPTPAGRFLQLALYTAAARIVLDRPHAEARGAYWFVTRRGEFETAGYRVTPDVAERALGIVERIVDGIGAGLFPQAPAEPGWRMFVDCEFCEPDGLGTSHQYADFRRVIEDPAIEPWLTVATSGGEGDDA
ncbi:MAG: PD-(D/E)XK nuclease family protein [Acidimicrobiales bacterium]|nr:PD-(D/E)XK nuclease family protein [Acidimicrobiales bacterium]